MNEAQREAVIWGDGPILILAGAGSGKTRTITHRIAHLIQSRGVKPWEILAVTFTNKAANEMGGRVNSLLGTAKKLPYLGTFHSVCLRILRLHPELLGYGPGFVIYDEKDQSSLVEKLLEELHADEKLKKPLLNFIDEMKNEGKLTLPEFSSPREKKLAELFGFYQRKLKGLNAMDFGDLLCNTIKLLSEHEEVRLKYEDLFRYIIVDEFQDTNAAQYKILRLLTRGRKNICVVGDDDQSIYSWRGARIENILSFDRDYPGAKVVKLENNYRSTQMILSAASELVSHNAARHNKRLYATRESGERLNLLIAADDMVEAKMVVSKIMELRKKYDYGSIAVLYRTNAQSRLFEDVLRAVGIPYVVVGALMFYARTEIKDLLAYLKVLINPHDSISFLRIINKPARGIGAKAVEKMAARAAEKGVSLFDAFIEIAYDSDDKLHRKLFPLAEVFQTTAAMVDDAPCHEIAEAILDKTGYLQALRDENSVESRERIENIEELLASMKVFAEETGEKSLRAYLDKVTLKRENENDLDGIPSLPGSVSLMTVHAAKGLEFPVVFIVGCEEELFPHVNSLGDDRSIEEERRLMYVAMTRAKDKLFLSFATRRASYRGIKFNQPSRFLKEIPQEFISLQEIGHYVYQRK